MILVPKLVSSYVETLKVYFLTTYVLLMQIKQSVVAVKLPPFKQC